ncbi:MAG: lytic transglycosylase F [Arenicellales bacterium]|nr:lytic transglycosylase F [Arenicellales bacterium]
MKNFITSLIFACCLLVIQSSGADEVDNVSLVEDVQEKWTGDFDGMVERRLLRVLVVYNKTMYFLDGADQHGLTYDMMVEFEKFIKKKIDTGNIPIRIVFIPVTRDQLLPKLAEGQGDLAVANLTITSERSELVSFTDPVLQDVKELVVTGPSAPEVKVLDDLSGKTVHVRPSSSYFESLQLLNKQLAEEGKDPVELVEADEQLEDADLLEMVNAGIIDMVVVDSHKAHFWKDIFSDITVHDDIAVNTGGEIAWAIRKNSPKLAKLANEFIKDHKKGTMVGNMLYKRYLKDNKWIKNSVSEQEMKKLVEVINVFREYAEQYDFDWLMLVAMGYQESGLDHSKRSKAGAIGIMQMMPATASDPNVAIKDITKLSNNVHAGTKYLRFLKDRYFNVPEIDDVNRTLLAFASYNAGPARINKLREEAKQKGLDPNVWFDNVEVVAAKRIGRETVSYVGNIYKYYVAYRLYVDRLDVRETLGIKE